MVFNIVNDLKIWEFWLFWKEMDLVMKVIMGNFLVGVGVFYFWKGEVFGEGCMEIIFFFVLEKLMMYVDFKGQGGVDVVWMFKLVDGGMEIIWVFYIEFFYFFNVMLLFQDFEGVIEKDYDRGLELLKEQVEVKVVVVFQFRVWLVELLLCYFIVLW